MCDFNAQWFYGFRKFIIFLLIINVFKIIAKIGSIIFTGVPSLGHDQDAEGQ